MDGLSLRIGKHSSVGAESYGGRAVSVGGGSGFPQRERGGQINSLGPRGLRSRVCWWVIPVHCHVFLTFEGDS